VVKKGITMNEILEKYKQYLLARGQSLVYYHYTKTWLKYCLKKNIDYLNITQEHITQFFMENKYASNSKNNFLKSGKNFYAYSGLTDDKNEWGKVKYMDVERKIPNYLTKEDLDIIVRHLITYSQYSSQYIKALLWFMFYTGVRKGELCYLKRELIDLRFGKAKIWGKKSKQERIVYFPLEVKQYLKDYFIQEQEVDNAFNMNRGKLNYIVKLASEALGRRVNAHLFRHSAGRNMIDNNISPLVVQRILGHASLQTTLIYTNPDDKMCERIYKENIK